MKRSRLGPKTYEEAKARYKPMRRNKPLRNSGKKHGKMQIAPVVQTEATLTKSEPVLEGRALADSNDTTTPRPSRVTLNCKICDRSFEVPPCRVRTGQKCCSVECARGSRKTKLTRKCKECGSEFSINPSQFRHYKGAGQFCSKKCKDRYTVKVTADKPIKDRYGRSNREADKVWAKAVKEKDDYTCRLCGKRDLYIHAHHIAPRSRRPDLKFVVENGCCLHAACHNWVHWHPKEATALGLLSDASYESHKKKDPTPCTVCGSTKRYAGHGFCIMHYKRFKKYGDPLLTKPHGGAHGAVMRVTAEASMR